MLPIDLPAGTWWIAPSGTTIPLDAKNYRWADPIGDPWRVIARHIGGRFCQSWEPIRSWIDLTGGSNPFFNVGPESALAYEADVEPMRMIVPRPAAWSPMSGLRLDMEICPDSGYPFELYVVGAGARTDADPR